VFLQDKEQRNEFLTYTNDNGVMTRPAWQLMHRLPMFSNCQHDGLKNSEWIEERLVNVPSSVVGM
jgi:dTDP-4-amino-4,6-dideoxygalactose transaminase